MMALSVLLISLLTANAAHSYSFHHAQVGDNVTLPCVFASAQNAQYLSWYRQAAGEQPQLISFVYKSSGTNSFFNQFQNNKRFSVNMESGFYDLKISDVKHSDSAVYYCGKTHVTTTEFDRGAFLLFNESIGVSLLQQNVFDSVVAADSVTLNCTVHNVTSSDHHEVYWLRQDLSGLLGVLYVHTSSSSPGRCVRRWGSAEKSCHYSLTKRNLSPSDSGTYYCAVASCGEILFGKGSRLDFGEKRDKTSSILILCASAVLSGSVFLNIILISIVCKMSRRKSNACGESKFQTGAPGYIENSQTGEDDVTPYVALDFKKRQSDRRRHMSTEEETVYSAVKVTK